MDIATFLNQFVFDDPDDPKKKKAVPPARPPMPGAFAQLGATASDATATAPRPTGAPIPTMGAQRRYVSAAQRERVEDAAESARRAERIRNAQAGARAVLGAVPGVDEGLSVLETGRDAIGAVMGKEGAAASLPFSAAGLVPLVPGGMARGPARGLFTKSGEVNRTVARRVMRDLASRADGFTFDPKSLSHLERGFMVANPRGQFRAVMEGIDGIDEEQFINFLKKNKSLIDRGYKIGGWRGPVGFELEMAEDAGSLENALKVAGERNERAVFDIENMTEHANPNYVEGRPLPVVHIPKGNTEVPVPAAARLADPPEVVQDRLAQAHRALDEDPITPWTPTRRGFVDPDVIGEDDLATAGRRELPHERATAKTDRASLGHLVGIDSPENIRLIERQIERGQQLGGKTFYPSVKAVLDVIAQRGGDPLRFRNATSAGSIRNALDAELMVGSVMQMALERGWTSLDEIAAAAAKGGKGKDKPLEQLAKRIRKRVAQEFPDAPGVPMFGAHLQSFEGLRSGRTPTSYKVPTYDWQKGGGKWGWVGDTHEATGDTMGSPFHRYFANQGGFGAEEYGPFEGAMEGIAYNLGLTPRNAQASRWMGGGVLTGLKSPMGDYAQHFEDSLLYNARRRTIDPERLLDRLAQGQDILYRYNKNWRDVVYPR